MSNVDKETGEIVPEMSDADYLAELGLDPIPQVLVPRKRN